MNDPHANPDRARPRAADLHRHRVMDPADAMVNHILDLACGGDVTRARATLREATRRDPGFVDRYERTARVLSLLKDGDDSNDAGGCPDLAKGIFARVEQQRILLHRPRTLGRGRSAIAGAGLAFMAVVGVLQFRTAADPLDDPLDRRFADGGALSAGVDDAPSLVQASPLASGRLLSLWSVASSYSESRAEALGWSLPPHATGYDGLSTRMNVLPLHSPTARRAVDRPEAFTCVASWKLAPPDRDAWPAGLMGSAAPPTAIEDRLRHVMDR